MATRNVVITERQSKLIEALVRSGRYQNASEVLREGLRLIEQREQEDAAKLRALQEAVAIGLASPYKEFPDVEAAVAYLKEMTDQLILNASGAPGA